MKRGNILKNVVFAVGLMALLVISLPLLRFVLPYSRKSNVILAYYLLCVLSALAFMLIDRRYRLKTRYILTGLMILCFLYQFVYSVNVHLVYEGDLRFYFSNAVSFTKNGFDQPLFYHSLFPTTATYPAFLVPFMKLFGTGRMVPIVINQLSMTGMSCMTYFFCIRTMGRTFSLGAAFMVCLHPFTIIYSNTCNAELIFGTLVFAAFFITLKVKDASRLRQKLMLAALGAALCALSNLFRPLGIVMLIALAVQILLSCERRRTCLVLAATLIVFYALVQQANLALQKHVTKYPPSAGGFGWNLYVGASEKGIWNEADSAEFARIMKQSETPAEVHEYFLREAVKRYRAMGSRIIKHSLLKLEYWYAYDYMAMEAALQDENSPFYSADEKETYRALIGTVDYPVLILAILTCLWVLFSSLRGKEHEITPLVFYLLGSMAALTLLEIAPRYTVSYRPLFCVLSFYGIHLLLSAGKARAQIRQGTKNH